MPGQVAAPPSSLSKPGSAPFAQAGARNPATNAALQLLQFEADIRRARSLQELLVFVVNGARSLVHSRHVFAVEAGQPTGIAVAAVTTGIPLEAARSLPETRSMMAPETQAMQDHRYSFEVDASPQELSQ